MLERLKSLPLTILLTILVWMYAEAQFTDSQSQLPLHLQVLPPNSDLTLRMVEPADGLFRLTIQGSKHQIEKTTQQLRGISELSEQDRLNLVFNPELSQLTPGGSNTIDSVTVLNSLKLFRQRGITVLAATPEKLVLETDQLKRVTRPIQFRANALSLAAPVVLSPAQAVIELPQGLWKSLGGDQVLEIEAIPQRDLQTLAPQVEHTVAFKLEVHHPGSPDGRIRILPARGQLQIRLQPQKQQQLQISRLPVWVSGPPALLTKVDVQIEPKILSIVLSGPEAQIQALRNALTQGSPVDHFVRAYIDVDATDRASRTPASRDIRYLLPDGMQLRSGPRQVQFRIVDQSPVDESK